MTVVKDDMSEQILQSILLLLPKVQTFDYKCEK